MKAIIISKLRAWSLGVLSLLVLAVGPAPALADIFFTEYGSTPSLSTVNRVNDAGVTIWSRNVDLDSATGIAVDGTGNVYVANTGRALNTPPNNSTIVKYDANGNFIARFNVGNIVPPNTAPNTAPIGLTIGPDGFLYTSATNTNQIFRINPTTGAFSQFNTAGPGGTIPPPNLPPPPDVPRNYLGLAFDGAGRLYVADNFRNEIDRYSASGAYLGVFASTNMDGPYGIAFDRFGNLFVANYSKLANPVDTITVYSPTGTFSTTIANSFPQLAGPAGLAFDAQGNLLVANNFVDIDGAGSIVKFSISYTGSTPTGGTFLGTVKGGLNGPVFLAVPEPASVVLAGTGILLAAAVGIGARAGRGRPTPA
jgi:hypothetical protein